jgi:PadR family transcriptional regulator
VTCLGPDAAVARNPGIPAPGFIGLIRSGWPGTTCFSGPGRPFWRSRLQVGTRTRAPLDRSLTSCKINAMVPSARIPTLPPKEALILELLVEEPERYGLELVASSKGRLKRGTVYVTLGRMEEKGFITSHLDAPPKDRGGLPRRIYEPTALGRRVLKAYGHVVRLLKPELA